jgi:hypothetical protein
MLEPDCDEHMKVLDKYKPFFEFHHLLFALASMVDYGPADAVEDSGPFGTPCCKSHIQIDL